MDKGVVIFGLTRQDMNGKRGLATDFHIVGGPTDRTMWRYTVKLDSGEKFKVSRPTSGLRQRAMAAGLRRRWQGQGRGNARVGSLYSTVRVARPRR